MVTMFRFALDGCRVTPLPDATRPAPWSHPKKRANSTRFPGCFKVEERGSLGRREPGGQTALEGPEQALQPTALHALHHPLHLEKLLHQPVDVLDLHARSPSNPPTPGAIDDTGCTPLPRRHRVDDRDLAAKLAIPLIGRHAGLRRRRDRQLLHEGPEAAHLLYLLELDPEIGEVEGLSLHYLARQALGLLLVDLPMYLLDQTDDIAHAENARGHALRIEGLQSFRLFPDAEENDRFTRHVAHGKRGTTPCIAIGLRQNDAGEVERRAEGPGGIYRILAGHRIHDEEALCRVGSLIDLAHLLHEGLIDVQAPGRIHDQHVEYAPIRLFECCGRDRSRRGLGVC